MNACVRTRGNAAVCFLVTGSLSGSTPSGGASRRARRLGAHEDRPPLRAQRTMPRDPAAAAARQPGRAPPPPTRARRISDRTPSTPASRGARHRKRRGADDGAAANAFPANLSAKGPTANGPTPSRSASTSLASDAENRCDACASASRRSFSPASASSAAARASRAFSAYTSSAADRPDRERPRGFRRGARSAAADATAAARARARRSAARARRNRSPTVRSPSSAAHTGAPGAFLFLSHFCFPFARRLAETPRSRRVPSRRIPSRNPGKSPSLPARGASSRRRPPRGRRRAAGARADARASSVVLRGARAFCSLNSQEGPPETDALVVAHAPMACCRCVTACVRPAMSEASRSRTRRTSVPRAFSSSPSPVVVPAPENARPSPWTPRTSPRWPCASGPRRWPPRGTGDRRRR